MPATVRPLPAYIAASVASQTVTDHHNAQLRHHDDDDDNHDDAASEALENAVFSEPALALLNAFLDHLLFAFLSTARSPALAAVRSAVSEVLKPRLARDAIEAADEELHGLLTGDEEDDDDDDDADADADDDDQDGARKRRAADRWDVEKVWKRTRLRVMVYTRLGELEDDDEDRYVQQERGLSVLDDDDDDDDAGLVSWASAIFLTSVIEYVAEQTLQVSGQAAVARMAAKMKKLAREQHQQQDPPDTPHADRLVVEEPDVEKIALNAALGRLWRTWRKRVRSPTVPHSLARGIHPASSYHSLHRRQTSDATIDYSLRYQASFDSAYMPTETQIAANIPLPMGDNDIEEIEVPGLAPSFQDADGTGTQTPVAPPGRPTSAITLASAEGLRRRNKKDRPLSMPASRPMTSTFDRESCMGTDKPDDAPQATPLHEGQRQSNSDSDLDADMVAFAASTGMGLRMSTVDPIKTSHFNYGEEELENTPSGHESEPVIMHSKRMSVEKCGSPGLVRTFSTRSSVLRSPRETPVTTPSASQYAEGRSYLDDSHSDDETTETQAIGVARTSNVPIRNAHTPDSSADKGKYAAYGGYVEVQPRHFSSSSISARNTPTPEGQPALPARSLMRNRPNYEGQSAASPLYDQVLIEPKSRGSSLPALQEVEGQTSQSHQRVASESDQQSSSSSGKPMRNLSYRSYETPQSVAERQVQRSPVNPSVRSAASSLHRSPSERSTTPRGKSSASSTKKHGSFSGLHNGLDSDSQRSLSRALSERMSAEDRERQFDSLVKGKETVKYTITPANMRDPVSVPLCLPSHC